MPTVLLWRGYRFHFFSHEGSEPPHIHVSKDGCEAKFWLKDGSLAMNQDFRHTELKIMQEIIIENKYIFLERWNEHLNRQD